MTIAWGAITLQDSDYITANAKNQEVAYNYTRAYLEEVNRALADAARVFVEQSSPTYKKSYRLPGGGRLQRRGGQARSGAVKASGGWDVAVPLEEFGSAIAEVVNDVRYMTALEYERQLDTVRIQAANTYRYEIIRALVNNQARTFADPLWGSLTVQPLASGDSVLYPPVVGSDTEATDNHYLESGYLASAISDTNNPLPVLRAEIEEHFGAATGGDAIIVICNNAQSDLLTGLAKFDEVPDRFIRAGDSKDVPVGLPSVPGKVLGRGYGVWLVEWRYWPAGYLFALHTEAPPPLLERIDPPETGIPTGLYLAADDRVYPFRDMQWEWRFGLGVGNRLNGVVMELANGGSYTVPTGY